MRDVEQFVHYYGSLLLRSLAIFGHATHIQLAQRILNCGGPKQIQIITFQTTNGSFPRSKGVRMRFQIFCVYTKPFIYLENNFIYFSAILFDDFKIH